MEKKRVTFGTLKVGQIFSLGKFADSLNNIKVIPSVLIGDCEPFNVISLSNGRPRTFRDEEMVYVEEI